MKNYLLSLSLLAMLACESKKLETDTSGKGKLDVSVNKEVSEENIRKPLPADASKFKGEYVAVDDQEIKILIRDHPEHQGLLAGTTTVGNYKPMTTPYWYDEKNGVLTSKMAKGQNSFSIYHLNSTGDELTEVFHNWEKNQSDTTVYKRTQ